MSTWLCLEISRRIRITSAIQAGCRPFLGSSIRKSLASLEIPFAPFREQAATILTLGGSGLAPSGLLHLRRREGTESGSQPGWAQC